MLIKYVGQYAPVELAARPDLGPIALGAVIDVDDALGVLCCEQVNNWVPADTESQTVLDDFYRWVATHEKQQIRLASGDIVEQWVPRPLPDPEPPADTAATTTTARRRGAAETTQES